MSRAEARVSSAHRLPANGSDAIGAVARGSLLSFAGNAVSGLLTFAIAILVSRTLGTAGAGVFFQAVALFIIITSLADLGASTGLVRSISTALVTERSGEIRDVLIVALVPVAVVGFVFGLIVFVTAPTLAQTFFRGSDPGSAVATMRALAVFIPFASVTPALLAATRGFGTMTPNVAIQNVGKPTVQLAALAVLAAVGASVSAYVLAWGTPEIIALPVALAALIFLLARVEQPSDDPRKARSLRSTGGAFWRFAAPRGISLFLQTSIIWLDILLVGGIRSASEAGVYAATSRIATVGTFALQAVAFAIAPQLGAMLARHRTDEARSMFQTSTGWLIGLTWPAYLTIAIFAPVILGVFGPGFVSGSRAAVIICLAELVDLGTGNVKVLLLMGGRSWLSLLNSSVALFLNVALNLYLIPRLGIEGAAIAWAVAIVFENVITLVEVRYFMGIEPFGRNSATAACLAVFCYGAFGLLVRAVFGASMVTLLSFLVVATSAYVLLLRRYRRQVHLDVLGEAIFGRLGQKRAKRGSTDSPAP